MALDTPTARATYVAVRLKAGAPRPDRVFLTDHVDFGMGGAVNLTDIHGDKVTIIHEYGYWHVSGEDTMYIGIDCYPGEPDE